MITFIILCILFIAWAAYEYHLHKLSEALLTERMNSFATLYNMQRLPGESNDELRKRIKKNVVYDRLEVI